MYTCILYEVLIHVSLQKALPLEQDTCRFCFMKLIKENPHNQKDILSPAPPVVQIESA